MWQIQIFHEADKVALIGLAADTRIMCPLLGDRRYGATTVVVAGKNQAVVRQAEDLLDDRAIKGAGIALLKITAAGTANQQTVARERHAVVVGHVGDASIGMSRGGAHFEISLPEGDP